MHCWLSTEQEAQLLQRHRATHYFRCNLVNCCISGSKIVWKGLQ